MMLAIHAAQGRHSLPTAVVLGHFYAPILPQTIQIQCIRRGWRCPGYPIPSLALKILPKHDTSIWILQLI